MIVQSREHPLAILLYVDVGEVECPAETRVWIGYPSMLPSGFRSSSFGVQFSSHDRTGPIESKLEICSFKFIPVKLAGLNQIGKRLEVFVEPCGFVLPIAIDIRLNVIISDGVSDSVHIALNVCPLQLVHEGTQLVFCIRTGIVHALRRNHRGFRFPKRRYGRCVLQRLSGVAFLKDLRERIGGDVLKRFGVHAVSTAEGLLLPPYEIISIPFGDLFRNVTAIGNAVVAPDEALPLSFFVPPSDRYTLNFTVGVLLSVFFDYRASSGARPPDFCALACIGASAGTRRILHIYLPCT